LVQVIRLDNSGENLGLKNRLEKEGIGIQIEFTSPNTPEQNGQVKRSFATLWGRVRAMLNSSGIDGDLRISLWAKCAQTATNVSNILSRKGENSSYELFYEKEAKYSKNL
jgi:hypothetical protein